jgi:16S rRNA (cytidine1402-2'-O)-methyltransferase
LVLAGVPLGNPGDASARLVAALGSADIVAAEDTRRLRRLASDLDAEVPGRVVSYFDGNEERRTPELAAALRDGATVLVVTDGGMPSVSDPGYRLVVAAIADGVPVQVVPGPSAVTTALAASGLPCDRFCFEGFPPRKPAERRSYYGSLASEPRTLVFFEAPHRIASSLADLAAAFGADRPAAVCRELTKTYEEVRRGPLGELAAWAADGLRGEITVVVGGAPPRAPQPVSAADLAAEVADAIEAGTPRKDALSEVAAAHGLPKRAVYDAVLTAKRGSPGT